jgi:hypothetical protein
VHGAPIGIRDRRGGDRRAGGGRGGSGGSSYGHRGVGNGWGDGGDHGECDPGDRRQSAAAGRPLTASLPRVGLRGSSSVRVRGGLYTVYFPWLHFMLIGAAHTRTFAHWRRGSRRPSY